MPKMSLWEINGERDDIEQFNKVYHFLFFALFRAFRVVSRAFRVPISSTASPRNCFRNLSSSDAQNKASKRPMRSRSVMLIVSTDVCI